jgi:hypothetical protein
MADIRKYTSQYIDNMSFDETFLEATVLPVESDGTNLLRSTTKQVAKKITVSGDNTYIAVAPIGTLQATAGWQAKKIAVSGGDTVITWADGDANFDNVATSLTALSYS